MSVAQSFLAEFRVQAPLTRRFQRPLPEEKLTSKPRGKSSSTGQLPYDLSTVPGGMVRLLENHPGQARESFRFRRPASRQETREAQEESIRAVGTLLPKFAERAKSA